MKKPTLHKLNLTTTIFTYIVDNFWEDITRIIRYELGDEWYLNDDSCPADQLSKIDDALAKYCRKEFPKQTVKYYDKEEQEWFSSFHEDQPWMMQNS